MVVKTQEKDNLKVWMDSKPCSLLEKKNTSGLTNEIFNYKNYYTLTLSIELFRFSQSRYPCIRLLSFNFPFSKDFSLKLVGTSVLVLSSTS